MTTPKKYGHRGASGHAPENTLTSFKKALEIGVDGIEFDIQLSKDGIPVIIHDETLERTTNGSGAVNKHPYEELKMLDAGNGNPIPSLYDVCDILPKNIQLLIELKTDATKAVEEIIRSQVTKGWKYEQLVVLSFQHSLLRKIRAINDKIAISASFDFTPIDLEYVKNMGARIITPNIDMLHAELVTKAHEMNISVITWTANSPAQIEKARALGVDGIISDYPDRL